ncbi:hypothetical protein JCM8097_005359 [Rhodosporidiobolus ruineniae]
MHTPSYHPNSPPCSRSPPFPPADFPHLLISLTLHNRDRTPQPQAVTIGTLLKAQYYDPESWEANKVILTAFATFAGAIVAISQFGDLLVPAF